MFARSNAPAFEVMASRLGPAKPHFITPPSRLPFAAACRAQPRQDAAGAVRLAVDRLRDAWRQ
eukprot:6198533-Pleurochrysis_carterae.AAC.1